MAYITATELAANLGTVTDSDPRAQRVVDAASRAVDNYCRRTFEAPSGSASARDYVVGVFDYLHIHDIANTTDLAITIDPGGTGTDFEAQTLTDWRFMPLNQLSPTGAYWPYTHVKPIVTPFPVGGLVRITANWGWTAVPDDVQEATLLIAGQLLERHKSASGLVGIDVGAPAFVSRSLDANAQTLLAPFRRYP